MDNLPGFTPDNALKFLKRDMEDHKKKPQKSVMLISPNFVRLTDLKRKDIFKIPILRYC